MSDAIDTGDETYQAWREKETINIYTYLNYAISQNWINTSLLKDYVPSEENIPVPAKYIRRFLLTCLIRSEMIPNSINWSISI